MSLLDANPETLQTERDAEVAESKSKLKTARELLSLGNYENAVSLLEDAAPVCSEAAFVLADCYRNGIGVNGPQAMRSWFILDRLCEEGYVPAIVVAAYWIRDSYYLTNVRDTSIRKDDKLSLQLLERALWIEPDNADALCAFGVAYIHGRGCTARVDRGLKALHASVQLGNVSAHFHLGEYHLRLVRDELKQKKVPPDPQAHLYARKGLELLYKAAEAGDALAHNALADVYRDANFPTSLLDKRPNKKTREKCADKHDLLAAERGVPCSYVNIGEGFATGSGSMGFDFDQAAFYFERAYQSGVACAADALGYHYEKGSDKQLAEKINLPAAVAWYERGYELEHAAATMHLGECYDDGIGVTPDPLRAEQLYVDAMAWAKRDGDSSCLSAVKSNLVKLYVGRSFLDGSQGEARAKLVRLVGGKEADVRTKEARGVLTCLSQTTKCPMRRAKAPTASAPEESKTLESKLADLVGEGCARKLISTFTPNT